MGTMYTLAASNTPNPRGVTTVVRLIRQLDKATALLSPFALTWLDEPERTWWIQLRDALSKLAAASYPPT